jgi:uncharacterized protein (DUF1684 family)
MNRLISTGKSGESFMNVTIKRIFVKTIFLTLIAMTVVAQTPYQTEIQQWREKREAELKSDSGWLTVVGLFWLKEGSNRIGTDSANEIVLPAGTAPKQVGVIDFHQGKTVLRVEKDVKISVNGNPVTEFELDAAKKGKPDTVQLGDLSFFVIKRGDKYGVRVKNKSSRERLGFEGVKYFPAQESLRINARYVAYDKPKEIEIVNIIGDVSKQESPGYVVFALKGKEYRLEPVSEGKQLFFIFRDLTSGKTTYPAGRFLYADVPQGDTVVLDFNKAINPPCAFTSFATCPLPPPQNHLKVAIEAGEQTYHHSDS